MVKKRIAKLDFVRFFAILNVVFIHCVEENYPMNAEQLNGYSMASRVLATTLFCVGRLGVPLFLFLTGYLLLGKVYTQEDTLRFYKKKLLPLLLTTEIWIVLYDIIRLWAYEQPIDGLLILRQCLFLQYDGMMPHLWYMPMIVGVYLFIPFVSNALQVIENKYIIGIATIAALYYFLVPTVSNFTQIFSGFAIDSKLDVSFSGGTYGIMIVIGYLMQSARLEKRKLPALAVIFVTAMGLCIGQQLFLYNQGYSANTWYNSFFLLISAVALFWIILTLFDKTEEVPVIKFLAQNAFAIYIMHYMYIAVFQKMHFTIGKHIIGVLMMFVFSFTLSIISVLLIRKSNKLSKILFFN